MAPGRSVSTMTVNQFSIFITAALVLVFTSLCASAQTRVYYYEEPLSLDQMDSYKDTAFDKKNFDQVEAGMTQEEVLNLLGKPKDMKKQKRRKNRWTFHYFYPGGYRVNFKNGLVTGKESPR
jgi:outer membrane protein assembly factor BamE (lipoprotein component of BamABCDE complex)